MRTPAENQFQNNAFFNQIAKQLQTLRQQSYQQQKKVQQIKKIALLKSSANHNPQRLSSYLLKNIIIDFLRCQDMNYTYSVFLREGNILSSEVKNKSQILNMLNLKQMYDSSSLFKVSVVQMVLQRLGELQTLKKENAEQGIQVQLIKQDKTVNNMLLNQLAIAAVRKEVQEKEKKYFQSNLQALKKSLTGSIRMQLKKQFDDKLKNTRIEYEKQVQSLKQKTKQILILNPKLNPKIQEYVIKIGALQTSNMELNSRIKALQKEKITHNCFKMPKIIQKQKELDQLTKQVQKRKQQYQFALKTLHTSVQNLASQKHAVQPPKQTDLFLADLKNRKNTKQFMIDQMYGRMLVMDNRIQSISSDNTSLRETNRQLTQKNNQLQEQIKSMKNKYSSHSQSKQQSPKLIMIKPKQKSVLIGVCPDDFKVIKKQTKQNVIDELSSQQSGDDDSAIDRKASLKLQINRIHSQLQVNKNKLRLFVQNFQ